MGKRRKTKATHLLECFGAESKKDIVSNGAAKQCSDMPCEAVGSRSSERFSSLIPA